jgi:hypothetical protein
VAVSRVILVEWTIKYRPVFAHISWNITLEWWNKETSPNNGSATLSLRDHRASLTPTWARKGKGHPRTGREGPEGKKRYSSTLSLTSAQNEGGWSTSRPGRFTSGKETRYPLYMTLGGPQSRSGPVRKILAPAGIRYPDHPARSESL